MEKQTSHQKRTILFFVMGFSLQLCLQTMSLAQPELCVLPYYNTFWILLTSPVSTIMKSDIDEHA